MISKTYEWRKGRKSGGMKKTKVLSANGSLRKDYDIWRSHHVFQLKHAAAIEDAPKLLHSMRTTNKNAFDLNEITYAV